MDRRTRRTALLALVLLAPVALAGCTYQSETSYGREGDGCWMFCGGSEYEYNWTGFFVFPFLVLLLIVVLVVVIVVAATANRPPPPAAPAPQQPSQPPAQQQVTVHAGGRDDERE